LEIIYILCHAGLPERHGALIGSMLMSIIATCLAAGVNAIKYLTELQKNREKVLKNPEAWMPWNFDPMEVS